MEPHGVKWSEMVHWVPWGEVKSHGGCEEGLLACAGVPLRGVPWGGSTDSMVLHMTSTRVSHGVASEDAHGAYRLDGAPYDVHVGDFLPLAAPPLAQQRQLRTTALKFAIGAHHLLEMPPEASHGG